MYALYEESGKFLAGRVMSEADSSMQIELESGKRAKVKAAHVLMKFAHPEPSDLIARGQALAHEIDLDLAWEFAPDSEFGFAEFARDYFGANAGAESQAAALFCIFGAPHYFRRLGKGQFKKAPEETVKAALLGIERKKLVVQQIDAWASELVAGMCPAPIREQLYKILFRPDKNAAEYKALVDASKRAHVAPLDVLKAAGAIDSPYQFHWRRFLFDNFAKGTAFPALEVPAVAETLPLVTAHAFSIDDSATTEIDDALSVEGIGSGTLVVGVHIAAPGLALAPGSPIDKLARDRLSTVYMPGHKITMLPSAVVDAYTLTEGRECVAVSLYVTFDETTLDVRASETRLERLRIAANLRYDRLEDVVTEASLTGAAAADYAFAAELACLYRLARHLKAGREAVRGKPENFNRPDYTFRIEREADGTSDDGPRGDETVAIGTRQRGSPLDLIVAESMILANSTWGAWLQACGVPGIYRSQASMAPGVKVRMGTRAAPHAGMGVAQYAWSTSPLRRYVDLVNQWQIIACAKYGKTAALAAPFKPKDAQLLGIISDFESTYAEYNGFQSAIERYWALRFVMQQQIDELDAAVMKDGLVRADNLPLVFRAVGAENLSRGAHVRVKVGAIDLLTLDVHASVLRQLDAADAGLAVEPSADDADDADGSHDDAAIAGPISLAVDLEPADGAATSSAAPAAVAEAEPATSPAG